MKLFIIGHSYVYTLLLFTTWTFTINAQNLTIENLQTTTTDSEVLTTDVNGEVHKINQNILTQWEDVVGQNYIEAIDAASAGRAVVVTDFGRVGIGTTSPASKLEVRDDDFYLSLTGFNHGLSVAVPPANSYGSLEALSATDGGLNIFGLSSAATATGLKLNGIIGVPDPDNSTPAIELRASRVGISPSGLANDDLMLSVTNNGGPSLLSITGNGFMGVGVNITNPVSVLEVGGALSLSTTFTPGVAIGTVGLRQNSGELEAYDAAGNFTVISPHNFSLIPDGASEELAWAFYSERNGKAINVDMAKLARIVEQLSGEPLVFVKEKDKVISTAELSEGVHLQIEKLQEENEILSAQLKLLQSEVEEMRKELKRE